MDSNTHSTSQSAGLAALVAELQELAAQDPDGLTDAARAERVRGLRGLATAWKASGWASWPRWMPGGRPGPSRASRPARPPAGCAIGCGWVPGRPPAAVRTARALFGGPLTGTAQALVDGEISPAHAQVLAHGTQELPDHLAAEAEPVLVEAARRLDPPRLRRVVAHLCLVADPEGADAQAERRHQRRGLWVSPTLEGMVALHGLLEPEAGQIVLAALEPLARPADAHDTRSWWPAPGRCPDRAGPPQPGSRPAAPIGWGPAPAAGHRRPGQPPGPPPGGLGGEAGWAGAAGPGGVSAAGL